MFSSTTLSSRNLEFLIRTALVNGELSPGVAAEVNRYRRASQLNAEEQRYLAILDDALADGCIKVIDSLKTARPAQLQEALGA